MKNHEKINFPEKKLQCACTKNVGKIGAIGERAVYDGGQRGQSVRQSNWGSTGVAIDFFSWVVG